MSGGFRRASGATTSLHIASAVSAVIAVGLSAGCADKGLPPAPTVREVVAMEPIVRAQTPDEAFGGPRPPLDPQLAEVLDGRWTRQLPLQSLRVTVVEAIDQLDGDGTRTQRTDTNNYVWDARWGLRHVGGELRGSQPWSPTVIRVAGTQALDLNARLNRHTYAPLAVLEFDTPDELERRVRAEPGAYTARQEKRDGKELIRIEYRHSDKKSWFRWWLDPTQGYVVVEAESQLYGSPEHYGPDAVRISNMVVTRTRELKPGIIVPSGWSSHSTWKGWPDSLVHGIKDLTRRASVTVLEADPALDSVIFQVIRERPQATDENRRGPQGK